MRAKCQVLSCGRTCIFVRILVFVANVGANLENLVSPGSG